MGINMVFAIATMALELADKGINLAAVVDDMKAKRAAGQEYSEEDVQRALDAAQASIDAARDA